jgi:hypothetical protein
MKDFRCVLASGVCAACVPFLLFIKASGPQGMGSLVFQLIGKP